MLNPAIGTYGEIADETGGFMRSCVFRLFVAVVLVVTAMNLNAQVTVPFTPANQVSVTIKTTVTYDSASGRYTYNYTLSNAPDSRQEVWFFALQLNGDLMPDISSTGSPSGWTGSVHSGEPVISWAATEGAPQDPNSANVQPSPFQVKPGQSLGGFTFQSSAPPETVTFLAQGFTPLPEAQDSGDFASSGTTIPDWQDNSFKGEAVGPVGISVLNPTLGGRRPAVDGFLAFLTKVQRQTLNAPVAFVIKFSVNGESVDRSTFHANLNGIDVTQSFVSAKAPGDLTAVFSFGSSPLKPGRNVLLTSVNGIVPGTSRTATDVDRITFTVK